MKRYALITVGALFLIGSVAGFVIAPEHRPRFVCTSDVISPCPNFARLGWHHATYDAVRIGTWALLIVGLLLLAVGLINHSRRHAD